MNAALDTITPAQVRFLTALLEERGLPTDSVAGLTKRQASAEIDRVKRLPRPVRVPAAQPAGLQSLPLCKYMVTGDAGQRVQVEIVERKGGRRYLNVLVGAPGDWRKQYVSRATQDALVAKIQGATYHDEVGNRDLVGPEAAAVRFSREHKRCAACLSPLSDESQPGYKVGLGPVCVTRFAL